MSAIAWRVGYLPKPRLFKFSVGIDHILVVLMLSNSCLAVRAAWCDRDL